MKLALKQWAYRDRLRGELDTESGDASFKFALRQTFFDTKAREARTQRIHQARKEELLETPSKYGAASISREERAQSPGGAML